MGLELGEKERPVKAGDSLGPARAEVVTEPFSLDYFPTSLSANYAQRVLSCARGSHRATQLLSFLLPTPFYL